MVSTMPIMDAINHAKFRVSCVSPTHNWDDPSEDDLAMFLEGSQLIKARESIRRHMYYLTVMNFTDNEGNVYPNVPVFFERGLTTKITALPFNGYEPSALAQRWLDRGGLTPC